VSHDLLHRGTVQPISDNHSSVHIVTVSEWLPRLCDTNSLWSLHGATTGKDLNPII
jgi:hypothetical protein